PFIVSIPPTLNGTNYHARARLMQRVLMNFQKFRFIDGSFQFPLEDDPIYQAWKRCNMPIHSWFMNLVLESI
ncbi:hypothetical protein glysoja_029469, partial [Glycine soja]